tara:strand:+ start:342 stop:563 length:222 start_codon:yes stop_codon:yes gene_type:complete
VGILFLAFATALGAYIILYKALGKRRLKKTSIFWDIVMTIGIPILFIGSFAGLATAVLAGVIFSLFTGISRKK